MRIHLISTLVIAVILAIVFLGNPNLDMLISELFFNARDKHFYLNNNVILTTLHDSVRWITITIILSILGATLYHKRTSQPLWGLTYKKLAFLLLALAIGPGLIVNSVFKENWGRARPHHVIEFGGTKTYSPPIVMSDQCESNCSFVSGDAAVGFFFLALLFVFDRKYRRVLLPFGITTAFTFSSIRVLQGAHFLSDVLFAGIVTYLTIVLLSMWLFKPEKTTK